MYILINECLKQSTLNIETEEHLIPLILEGVLNSLDNKQNYNIEIYRNDIQECTRNVGE